jgi:hypothetical protein
MIFIDKSWCSEIIITDMLSVLKTLRTNIAAIYYILAAADCIKEFSTLLTINR